MLQDKRFRLVAFAILFVALVFIYNKGWLFGKRENNTSGLTYGTDESLESLANRDTDGDGVFDWEEGLWGTDPRKKDTFGNGIGDQEEINKIKVEQGLLVEGNSVQTSGITDQFSQEIFAAVATLAQTGELDAEAVEKISDELAVKLYTTSQFSKTYVPADIKVSKDNSKAAVQKFNLALAAIYDKYNITKGGVQIIEEAIMENGDIDTEALKQFDTLIVKVRGIIDESLKLQVPSDLAIFHLNLINALSKCLENFQEIRLLETDAVTALVGIRKYEENSVLLDDATLNISVAIWNIIK